MALEMTVQQLRQKLDAGDKFKLVDVREPHEYEEYNIGATLIPLGTIPENLDQLGGKDEPIVLHCRSGARSGQAQRYLINQGYTNVTNVKGGALAWRENYGEAKAR